MVSIRNRTETDETTKGNAVLVLGSGLQCMFASELLIEMQGRYLKGSTELLIHCSCL